MGCSLFISTLFPYVFMFFFFLLRIWQISIILKPVIPLFSTPRPRPGSSPTCCWPCIGFGFVDPSRTPAVLWTPWTAKAPANLGLVEPFLVVFGLWDPRKKGVKQTKKMAAAQKRFKKNTMVSIPHWISNNLNLLKWYHVLSHANTWVPSLKWWVRISILAPFGWNSRGLSFQLAKKSSKRPCLSRVSNDFWRCLIRMVRAKLFSKPSPASLHPKIPVCTYPVTPVLEKNRINSLGPGSFHGPFLIIFLGAYRLQPKVTALTNWQFHDSFPDGWPWPYPFWTRPKSMFYDFFPGPCPLKMTGRTAPTVILSDFVTLSNESNNWRQKMNSIFFLCANCKSI